MSAKVKTESDIRDTSVAIEDVHIGRGGEARTVRVGYDEVKRTLCLKIYDLGDTEVLQEFRLAGGKIFAVYANGNLSEITDGYPF